MRRFFHGEGISKKRCDESFFGYSYFGHFFKLAVKRPDRIAPDFPAKSQGLKRRSRRAAEATGMDSRSLAQESFTELDLDGTLPRQRGCYSFLGSKPFLDADEMKLVVYCSDPFLGCS